MLDWKNIDPVQSIIFFGLFNDAVSAQNIMSNDKIINESPAGHSVEVRSCTYLAEVFFRKITAGTVEITRCVGNDVVLISKLLLCGGSCYLHVESIILDCIDSEGSRNFPRNIGEYLPVDTAS